MAPLLSSTLHLRVPVPRVSPKTAPVSYTNFTSKLAWETKPFYIQSKKIILLSCTGWKLIFCWIPTSSMQSHRRFPSVIESATAQLFPILIPPNLVQIPSSHVSTTHLFGLLDHCSLFHLLGNKLLESIHAHKVCLYSVLFLGKTPISYPWTMWSFFFNPGFISICLCFMTTMERKKEELYPFEKSSTIYLFSCKKTMLVSHIVQCHYWYDMYTCPSENAMLYINQSHNNCVGHTH